MTKLNTTLLKDLPIKQTSITDNDYVVVSSGGTKKLKIKDITKDVEKKAANLEEKTTELSEQLDNKANNKDVVKKGFGTLNDFDEETRALIQGLKPGQINAVLGEGNVTPQNTNFIDIKTGKNLFNINSSIVGKNINESGVIYDDSGYSISDFIKVNVGSKYTVHSSSYFYLCFYDSNKLFVSGTKTTVNPALTFTAQYTYVRICYRTSLSDVMLEEGEVVSSFEAYKEINELNDTIKIKGSNVEDGSITQDKLDKNISFDVADGSVTPTKTTFLKVPDIKNLHNINTILSSKNINDTSGQTFDDEGYDTSEFIELTIGETYTASASSYIFGYFYNDDKSFVSGSKITINPTLTFTAEYKYIRIASRKVVNSIQLEKGSSKTEYEPYPQEVLSELHGVNVDGKCIKYKSLGLDRFSTDVTNQLGYNRELINKDLKYIAITGQMGSCPANNVEAFIQSAHLGAFGVEFDMRLTKDDNIVVIHDELVSNVLDETDGKKVSDYTLVELKNFKYKEQWIKDYYTKPIRINTLEEAIECCKKYNLFMFLELKNDGYEKTNQTKFVNLVIDKLLLYGVHNHCALITQSESTASLIRSRLPHATISLKRYIASTDVNDDIDMAKRIGGNIIMQCEDNGGAICSREILTDERIKKYHENNFPVKDIDFIFTFNKDALLNKNIRYVCNFKTTDNGESWSYDSANSSKLNANLTKINTNEWKLVIDELQPVMLNNTMPNINFSMYENKNVLFNYSINALGVFIKANILDGGELNSSILRLNIIF